MKTAPTACLVLLAACLVAVAQIGEAERVLNLKGLPILGAGTGGTSLFLVVTNKPPEFLSLIRRLTPTPLQQRDSPGAKPRVLVTLGKDILGVAEVRLVTDKPLGLVPGADAPRRKLTTVLLNFQTAEEAARAAEALRWTNATPKPLRRENNEEKGARHE